MLGFFQELNKTSRQTVEQSKNKNTDTSRKSVLSDTGQSKDQRGTCSNSNLSKC